MLTKKYFVILLFLLFLSNFLIAKNKIEGSLLFAIDSDNPVDNLWNLEGRIGLIMDLPKKMKAKIGLETNQFDVKPYEVSFQLGDPDIFRISIGYEKNSLTLEEFIFSFYQPINYTGLLSQYFKLQGYVARNIGVKLYKNYKPKKSHWPISWWIKIAESLPHIFEPQLDAGIFYHFSGENAYLGLSTAYLPYIVNAFTIGQGFDPKNYFSITASFANFDGPLVYSIETAFGSNLSNPLAIYSLPPNENQSYFLGSEVLLGWKFYFENNLLLIPALRYSLLFSDINAPQYNQHHMLLGNQIYISEEFKLFLDIGGAYTNAYSVLTKNNKWEMIWLIGAQISTKGIDI